KRAFRRGRQLALARGQRLVSLSDQVGFFFSQRPLGFIQRRLTFGERALRLGHERGLLLGKRPLRVRREFRHLRRQCTLGLRRQSSLGGRARCAGFGGQQFVAFREHRLGLPGNGFRLRLCLRRGFLCLTNGFG